ncbi:MAG: hypothetical protein IKK17_02790 [Oscillospiraceae bacterium]|nr:hypothetical protein [Oscillospiraceae bacterium]
MTKGIPASRYADKIYYRSYIAMDGGYCYGDIQEYSVKQYCESRFEKTEDANLKPLLAAILHYGSAAQNYFGYKPDALVNADMGSYVERGWIDADLLNMNWDEKFLIPLVKPTEDMAQNFAASGTLPAVSKSLLLEGAISVNYYATFGEDAGVFADAENVIMCFWTAEDYVKLLGKGTPMSAENASYTVKPEMVYSDEHGWEYKVTSQSIPAACWGDSVYSALCVTDSEGVEHCSGIITYSPARFAYNKLNDEEQSSIDELVKWMTIYCDRAKTYFNNQ